ncbi:MAG: adenosylcobalamin-dependent ribonucleoside-diphosphate reductase [Deltaproteobacteria bacterium]|nr:adenosylcobalamin-dependent ribonucleoside-diphosphate reductase [Deltaproteobacteria bacterium]
MNTSTQAPDAVFSPSAWAVLQHRYLRKDRRGAVVETPEEMFRRVARAVAAVEANYKGDVSQWEETFFHLMSTLQFLPNSPTLMNAGTPQGQLAACFVLPIEDSLESIFQAVKDMALIHQSGGGTGFSFSHLRPQGDPVASTGGVASGPISFLRVFDEATNVIKQGGRRRGANMAVLRVDHPDILEFIRAKEDPTAFTNFNFSVAVDDAFMQAATERRLYALRHPVSGAVVREIAAQELLATLARAAWTSGDPGVLFVDQINRCNPTPRLGTLEATNPCGEQPLLPYESCVLGSVNLTRCVRGDEGIDWETLRTTVSQAVRFLDDVIDASHAPLRRIEERSRLTRKIGLGVMGFADLLIMLGMPYGSPDSFTLAERLMGFITTQAQRASMALAREGRGPFPEFPGTVWDQHGGPPLRNATLTTIAPTGTISILAGVSSGIEPLFALAFTRTVLEGRQLQEINSALLEALERRHLLNPDLIAEISATGSLASLPGVPADLKALFVTSHELAPEVHVRMQAAFQRHTDNAVSKTVNLPETATPADIETVIHLGHHLRCKGITVFRDGCKGSQVLSLGIPSRAVAESGKGGLQAGLEFSGECRNCTV